jgi:hypothetical protein
MEFLLIGGSLLAILVAYAANPPRHVAQGEIICAPQPAIAGRRAAVQIDGSGAVMLAGHSASSSTYRAVGVRHYPAVLVTESDRLGLVRSPFCAADRDHAGAWASW